MSIAETELYHHGILGQRWGVKNGPPYPLRGGDYTQTEIQKIKAARKRKNSAYNKKHYDKMIEAGTAIKTLSYDPNRTKNVDMFYATYEKLDIHQYQALFNKKAPMPIFDKDGNEIGTGNFYKYSITNRATRDIKVASEDSSIKAFTDLYSKDRDFYNYVTDPKRMQAQFVDSKYVFKAYRQARSALEKMRKPGYTPTDRDLATVYRMFNYTIPADGGGNARVAKDVATQRAKFFKSLKDSGYGAVLDTNDALYGGFKATAPVIVFDMESVIPDKVRRTNLYDQKSSQLITAGRKICGM